jgi:hypothetical protein
MVTAITDRCLTRAVDRTVKQIDSNCYSCELILLQLLFFPPSPQLRHMVAVVEALCYKSGGTVVEALHYKPGGAVVEALHYKPGGAVVEALHYKPGGTVVEALPYKPGGAVVEAPRYK